MIDSAWVFAYGSNMDLDDLRRWFDEKRRPWGTLHRAVSATLPGFSLVWNFYSKTRKGGAANVRLNAFEEAPSLGTPRLPGVALHVDAVMFDGIDRKEGYPHVYGRTEVAVDLSTGERVDAWVYVLKSERESTDFVPPTTHYRGLLIRGARAHGLPEAHIEELERLPTLD